MINKFKSKLSNNEFVVGPFMKTGDPAFVEVAGHAGFDFVILDMEHGPANPLSLQNLIRAAEASNVMPIVRVSENKESVISKALDVGAKGVQVPQISCAKEAEAVVKAAKFSPEGERGVCRFVRAANYSATDRFEYFKNANKDNIIIIHLEGTEAIKNLDEILAVEGIDILFIGPYDLSQSLGVAGQVNHPIVEEKMIEIVKKAKKSNKCIGTFVDSIEDAHKWKERGIQYLSYSVDVGIFYEACKKIVQDI